MILLLLAGCALSIILTAMSLSLRDMTTPYLRYWARRGEPTAKALYPLKSQGSSVLLTIELFRALAVSGTLITIASLFWGLLAWLAGAVLLFLVFIVLGELYLKPLGARILAMSSSQLLAIVHFLKPITYPLGRIFDRFLDEQPVTLTRYELNHMLSAVTPADTDLSDDELRIIKHALSFGEKSVHDVMTPQSVISTVKVDDILSPTLLDELYKTGHSRFPVMDEDGAAIGLLYVKDLLDVKDHSTVKQLMHKPAYFVNENRELDHVLQAFIKTKQHLFLVVNEFAEVTGLVTIEDIIEQILGKPIIDEFDTYDSMRAVAEAKAKTVRKQIKMVE